MKTVSCFLGVLACCAATSAALADSNGLSFHQTRKDGPVCSWLDGAHAVAVSPDGLSVYAANRDDDSVTPFRWENNQLSCQTSMIDDINGSRGLNGALGLAVSPDGKNVYVAGSLDDSIAAFTRNTSDGQLAFLNDYKDGVADIDGLNGVRAVALDSKGEYLLAAGYTDDALAIFHRDSTTGALSYWTQFKDGPSSDGLAGASDVVLSPDDLYVYVAGYVDDAIAIFARNPGTGALTYAGLANALLDGPRNLAITRDGLHLVAANYLDDSVAMFERDPLTGTLTLVEVEVDGLFDGESNEQVDGLNGAWDLSFGPNDDLLYVASTLDDAIAVFRRNADLGTLEYLGMERDGVNDPLDPGGTVDGLNGARGVAASSTGPVFTAGATDNAVSVFTPTV